MLLTIDSLARPRQSLGNDFEDSAAKKQQSGALKTQTPDHPHKRPLLVTALAGEIDLLGSLWVNYSANAHVLV